MTKAKGSGQKVEGSVFYLRLFLPRCCFTATIHLWTGSATSSAWDGGVRGYSRVFVSASGKPVLPPSGETLFFVLRFFPPLPRAVGKRSGRCGSIAGATCQNLHS